MEASERVVVVVGEGTETAGADICDLWLGLQIMAPTATEAIERVTEAAQAALRAVRDAGVGPEDAQTQNLTVQEFFDHAEQRPTGHTAYYGLTVRGRPIDEVGSVIGAVAAVAQGALRVNAIQLRFSDPEPLRRVARRRAVEDAQSKAAELADATGIALGPLVRIEHGPSAFPFGPRPFGGMYLPAAALQSAPSPPPIEAGSTNITASVTMTFQIQG
jgi:uncharacterized protein YggE